MKTLDRRNTSCVKWDSCPEKDMLPLWVADMDFETAPAVVKAVQERSAHGIYGYTIVPDSYYDAIIGWFERRHAWRMERQQIICTTGVVPAISAIIDAVSRPGDDVVCFTPAYNCFFSSIRNKGCRMSASQLVYDEQNASFNIDFQDLEQRLSHPKASVMLLCNPHNPSSRVWTADELRRIGDLCLKHGVFVISDEIHCEFTMPGHTYTPYASLGESYAMNCAVCTSPSKAFNIAGLQAANITIPNPVIRTQVDRSINDAEICDLGVFGPVALEAAYNHGDLWMDQLNSYICSNYHLLKDFIDAHLPQIKVCKLEGTYLVWADCSAYIGSGKAFASSTEFCAYLKERMLWINPGDMYDNLPSAFVRINIACSKETLSKALERLRECLSNI